MTYAQIRSRVYLLTSTNSSSLSDANLTLYTQPAEDRVNALINKSDQRWQFDDSNYSDLPIAVTTVTSGQQDYSLSIGYLTIDKVRIKDSGNNWHLLVPIDAHDLKNDGDFAYFNSSGLPTRYDKLGTSIFLGPIPNYTKASALEVTFSRAALKFDYGTSQFTDGSGSTSSSPGFNILFHDLIPLWASFDFCSMNGLDNANQIFAEIQRKEQECADFYGLRSRDERPRMGVSTSRNRSGAMSGVIGNGWGDSTR